MGSLKTNRLFLKSAGGGYRSASYMMGHCYHYGNGTLKDEGKAFEWYLKAAKKDDSFSQYLVANYYNDGKHVPKDKEKEFYWNRKAAINGINGAQYELAKYYLNDSIINNKSERKAFKWHLKLADIFPDVKYYIAKCYRDGVGTDKDLDEAVKWLKKCAGNDYFLLNDFLNGSGSKPVDISKSFWF